MISPTKSSPPLQVSCVRRQGVRACFPNIGEISQETLQHLSKVADSVHFCPMLFVVGCVLTNVLLLLWLRLLRAPVFSLVTLNYFVCVVLAALMAPPQLQQIKALSGIGWSVLFLLGILFISVFALTGKAAREVGIGLSGMLAKLSVILPVTFAGVILKEPFSTRQQIGVLAGIGAIVAIHAPYLKGGGWRTLLKAAQTGLLLWLGNGVIDILFKAAQPQWRSLSTLQIPLIIMSIAGILGVSVHFYRGQGRELFRLSTWKAALLLGTTNLLSIFFYLKGLEALPAIQFFLWNNLGIVLLSGLTGILFFRERFSWEIGIGYGLGAGAIVLVS